MLEDLLHRRYCPLESGLEAGAQVRPHVEDHAVRLDRAGGVHRRVHRHEALLVELVLRAGEVDQVEGVDEDSADTELYASRTKRLEILRVVLREPPRPRALDEELERVRVELSRPVERLLDSAGTVGAEEHGAYATARAATHPARPSRPARR